MKTKIVYTAATLTFIFTIAAFAEMYFRLPVVEKVNGVCVRVIVEKEGRAVEKPCSSIDLEHGIYVSEEVGK